ncbi:hypothetical protein COCNU_scaffold017193G000030 [Cocos nucifera]|nr:hypothetical protein [Cocos nucifera]
MRIWRYHPLNLHRWDRRPLHGRRCRRRYCQEDEDADNAYSRKRAKREAIVGPAVDKGVAHEVVGLEPATLILKEVPAIKKKIPMLH